MLWIKINNRWRVDFDKVCDFGIPLSNPGCIQVEYLGGGSDTFEVDDPEVVVKYLDRILSMNYYPKGADNYDDIR